MTKASNLKSSAASELRALGWQPVPTLILVADVIGKAIPYVLLLGFMLTLIVSLALSVSDVAAANVICLGFLVLLIVCAIIYLWVEAILYQPVTREFIQSSTTLDLHLASADSAIPWKFAADEEWRLRGVINRRRIAEEQENLLIQQRGGIGRRADGKNVVQYQFKRNRTPG